MHENQNNSQHNKHNTNHIQPKEASQPPSQIITNTFLEKCLEGVHEKLIKQLSKQQEDYMTELPRKLFATQAQVQPHPLIYKPYQTTQANSHPSVMMGPTY